jgi:hypothetical protein
MHIIYGNKIIAAIHSIKSLGLTIIMQKSYWPIHFWINP